MEAVISFANVNKYFYLQHQKTIKELFQAIVKRGKKRSRIHALQDVSFEIKKGETVGIIGRNGAGKSTLLKLIAGVSDPTSGKVSVSGRIAPLIELGAGFHPELTGKENIFLNGVILGLSEKYLVEKFPEIVAFSEIEQKFIETPVKYYSSGMYARLAFSVAMFMDPEILLIDEILSVGDAEFKKKCFAKMEEFKKKNVTIVYVSHANKIVKSFCDRAIYLKQGKVVYDGDSKTAVNMYTKDYE